LRETSIPGKVNGIQHYVIKFTVKNGSSIDFFSVNHPAMKQKHNSKEKLSGTYHNPMMYVAMTLSTKNLHDL
jgi:hypothetical protein